MAAAAAAATAAAAAAAAVAAEAVAAAEEAMAAVADEKGNFPGATTKTHNSKSLECCGLHSSMGVRSASLGHVKFRVRNIRAALRGPLLGSFRDLGPWANLPSVVSESLLPGDGLAVNLQPCYGGKEGDLGEWKTVRTECWAWSKHLTPLLA